MPGSDGAAERRTAGPGGSTVTIEATFAALRPRRGDRGLAFDDALTSLLRALRREGRAEAMRVGRAFARLVEMARRGSADR
jgi:hypothetical protein